MNKVFLVIGDNGYFSPDDMIETLSVHKTYRGASQHLINEGYVPYAEKLRDKKGYPTNCYTVRFVDGNTPDYCNKMREAWIEETELKE